MRVSGFVMTDESGEVLAVSVGGSGDLAKSLACGKDMKKSAPETAEELVAEHEHLVDVLRSPDHKDDLAEADKQEGELAEYRGEAAGEDMAKSHVKGYYRKDGTFVKEHDDQRQAAMQPVPSDRVNAIHDQHSDLMHRKETEWQHDAKKIPASAVSGLPEFSHKEVYGHNRDVSPVGGDFSPEFAKQGHQGFVLRHKDGKRSFVDAQGSDYARYHASVEDAPAGGDATKTETHAYHEDASSKMVQHGMDLEEQGYQKKNTKFADGGLKNGYSAEYYHPDGRKATVSMSRSSSAKGAWDTSISNSGGGASAGGDKVHSDDAFEKIKAAGGTDVTTTSGHINYTHNGQQKQLAHEDAADGQRYVDSGELEQHLSDMKGGAGNEADDPRVILGAMSAPKLKAAINAAVSKFGIHDSWSAPKTNDKEVLVDHIDSLCNEHHLRVMDDGSLTKAGAGTSSSGGGASYDHPNAVGKADFGSETPEKGWSMKFAGTDYTHTGKTGNSMHDQTPVREFESEDGHRVWADNAGRVHADSTSEVAGLRQKYEAHTAKSAKPAKAKAKPKAADGKPMLKALLFVPAGGAAELVEMSKSVRIGAGSGD